MKFQGSWIFKRWFCWVVIYEKSGQVCNELPVIKEELDQFWERKSAELIPHCMFIKSEDGIIFCHKEKGVSFIG